MADKVVAYTEIIKPGSNPDIDTDFAVDVREETLKYVEEKYGKDNVCNIVTFQVMGAKSALKNMCTIYNVPPKQANQISSLIPDPIDGKQCTFDDIYNPESMFYEAATDFRNATDNDSKWKQIISSAKAVSGRKKTTGVHACGVLISAQPLQTVIPMMTRRSDNARISQWTYQDCESLGLIKMDFLGLDTIDIIQNTIRNIIKSGKTPPNVPDLLSGDMDDPKVYDLFQKGNTIGVFQFGSQMVRDLLPRIKPDKFIDLAVTTSLARPGPMGVDAHLDFADRKNGRAPILPIHPDLDGDENLEEILSPTYGLMVFQEQIIRIANVVGGLSLQEGDKLRKAMGKKKAALMLAMKEKFMAGGVANGYSEPSLNALWDTMAQFASYGFNKCLHEDTLVMLADGSSIPIKHLYQRVSQNDPVYIMSLFEDGVIRPHKVSKIVNTGCKPLYEVVTASGKHIVITRDHRMLTTGGYGTIADGTLTVGTKLAIGDDLPTTSSKRGAPGWRVNVAYSMLEQYLTTRGVDYEPNAEFVDIRGCRNTADVRINGVFFEMDRFGRGRDYFVKTKYGDSIPFVCLNRNYVEQIDEFLTMNHVADGDPVVDILAHSEAQTYDIEMALNGPANFIANGLVSHNSHAVAYAMNSYVAAYLKTYYPVEFMSALISQRLDKKPETLEYLRECNRMGLVVGTPDINLSQSTTAPDVQGNSDIIFGLAGLQSVSRENAQKIVDERTQNGSFTSLPDFMRRCSGFINKTIAERLVQSGAFDSLKVNRKEAVMSIPQLLKTSKKQANLGSSLFDLFADEKTNMVDDWPSLTMPDNDYPFIERVRLEADAIGLTLGTHPLKYVGNTANSATPLAKIEQQHGNRIYTVLASISDMTVKRSKNSKRISVYLSDGASYMQAFLSRSVITRLDKYVAWQQAEKIWNSNQTKLVDKTRTLLLGDTHIAPLEPLQTNIPYVFKVRYFANRGIAQIEDIRVLTLGANGKLPVRLRYNTTKHGFDKFHAVTKKVATRFPGEHEIMVSQYSGARIGNTDTQKPMVETPVDTAIERCLFLALNLGAREHGRNVVSVEHAEAERLVLTPVERIDNMSYQHTGWFVDPQNPKLAPILDKYLGFENRDFGFISASVFSGDS